MDIIYSSKQITTLSPDGFMDYILSLDESEWGKFTDRQTGFHQHQHTKTIPALFPDRDAFPEITINDFQHTEAMRPFWQELVDIFSEQNSEQYIVTTAMVVRLAAGCSIELHSDAHPYFALTHRLHWALHGDYDDMDFMIAGEKIDMKTGDVVEINNRLPHCVKYSGKEHRYNFIVDLFKVP
jgi:hypothetical protein